jgi:hypothetical protein
MLCFVCAPTNNRQLAKRWAKVSGERRVHIPQSSTLASWSPRDVTAAQSRIGVLIATVNQSFPGHLDFERERWRGTNLCVFACGIAV